MTHPSSSEELPSEFFCGILEGKLFTTYVVDRWAALVMQEEVIFEQDFARLLLVLEVDLNREVKASVP